LFNVEPKMEKHEPANDREDNPPPLSADLLWGVKPIAREVNLTPHQTYHQLENGLLPAFKQSGRWVSTRSALRRHFADALVAKS
jgi:hypothetical protein